MSQTTKSPRDSAKDRRGDRGRDCLGTRLSHDTLEECRANRKLLGSIAHERFSVTRQARSLDEALHELPEELASSTAPLPIAAANPTDDGDVASRPTPTAAQGSSPRSLLHESPQRSLSDLDSTPIDVVHWQLDRRTVASLDSAPHQLIGESRSSVAASRHDLQRIAPAAGWLTATFPDAAYTERNTAPKTRVRLEISHLLAVDSSVDVATASPDTQAQTTGNFPNSAFQSKH
ncbi:MAG: hypothetical protein AAF989_00365 [Planctomycetota bacterium]